MFVCESMIVPDESLHIVFWVDTYLPHHPFFE